MWKREFQPELVKKRYDWLYEYDALTVSSIAVDWSRLASALALTDPTRRPPGGH